MSGEFAGTLTERVTLVRRGGARDALGAAGGAWRDEAELWAAVRPERTGAAARADAREALAIWLVTIRPRLLMPGDRLRWGERTMELIAVEEDPAWPDRMRLLAAERRR